MNNIDYRLMLVTDDSIRDDNAFFKILEASIKGGATIIQLREKSCSTLSFYERALKAKKLCQAYNIPLIINDRIDIALAIDADGVHIGQKDIPYQIARTLLSKNKIIGLSVSNIEQATEANKLKDIDYVGISPIFATSTKTKNLDTPIGIEGLKAIRKIFSRPIVSIGGINSYNAAEIIKNGSDGIALISAISKAENPKKESKKIKDIICQIGLKQ